MELEEKKIPFKNLGYSTYIIAQIFRYLTIVLVLTPFTITTGGIGGIIGIIIGIIFFKFILKLIPFKISLYENFKKFNSDEIDLIELLLQWKNKIKYTFILLFILLTSAILILVNDDNPKDRIFFSILFFVLILLLLPQYKYLNLIKREYLNENILLNLYQSDKFKTLKTQKTKFSLYNFYFGDNSNSSEKQTEKIQISEKLNKFTKTFKFKSTTIFEKLTSDEVIIISIIVGCIFCLIFGNQFGETQYYYNNGKRTSSTNNYDYSKIDFNYIMAIISFIITAGISYIYLNRKSKITK